MAFQIQQQKPKINVERGIGVSIPFNFPSAFRSVYSTSEQIKMNMINYLLTNPRERIFQPTFGAGLRRRVFEQITIRTTEEIEQSIIAGVEANFPMVEGISIQFMGEPDLNELIIQFSYRLKNTGQTDEILISLQNG